MAVVGAFLRVDAESQDTIRQRLSELDGVSLLDVGEPGKVGLVIEAANMDEAHARLRDDIQGLDGVLGAWPVYANFEPEEDEDEEDTEPDRKVRT